MSKWARIITGFHFVSENVKAGFHLNFSEKMNFCFFSKLATLTT